VHGFNNGNIQARSFLEVALEGFPWLSNANAQIVKEGTSFSCSAMVLVTLLCRKTGGLLEQTEDLASVDGEVPGVGAAVSHLQFISVSCFHFQAHQIDVQFHCQGPLVPQRFKSLTRTTGIWVHYLDLRPQTCLQVDGKNWKKIGNRRSRRVVV
jgi:hypothetical protein